MIKNLRWMRLMALGGLLAGCMAHENTELRQGADSREFPAPIEIVFAAASHTAQELGLEIKEKDRISHCLHASGASLRQGRKDVRICLDSLQPTRTLVKIDYLRSSQGLSGERSRIWSHEFFYRLTQALHLTKGY